HLLCFYINDPATPDFSTLSLHDALPILVAVTGRGGAVHGAERHRHRLVVRSRERDREGEQGRLVLLAFLLGHGADADPRLVVHRSEEHTSELQSLTTILFRLLL